MVLLGRISGLFGVKGWVRIHSDTEPRENILKYSPWYLQQHGEWQSHELLAGQRHGKGVVAHLDNCPDRDSAAKLVGCKIAIRHAQLPDAGENEFYWSELKGLRVVTTGGTELGEVTSLMETGANDVLVVLASDEDSGGKKRERLIPYIREQVIKSVDLETGTLVVDWDPDF